MTSPTQWTWAWASSSGWRWTGKPGVLQSMGSQTVGDDWATELNWKHWNIRPVLTVEHSIRQWPDISDMSLSLKTKGRGWENTFRIRDSEETWQANTALDWTWIQNFSVEERNLLQRAFLKWLKNILIFFMNCVLDNIIISLISYIYIVKCFWSLWREILKDLRIVMFGIIFQQFKGGKSRLWSMFPFVNIDALGVFIALFFQLFLQVCWAFCLRLQHAACGVLVPQPGMVPAPLTLEVQIPKDWTTEEIPVCYFFKQENWRILCRGKNTF